MRSRSLPRRAALNAFYFARKSFTRCSIYVTHERWTDASMRGPSSLSASRSILDQHMLAAMQGRLQVEKKEERLLRNVPGMSPLISSRAFWKSVGLIRSTFVHSYIAPSSVPRHSFVISFLGALPTFLVVASRSPGSEALTRV